VFGFHYIVWLNNFVNQNVADVVKVHVDDFNFNLQEKIKI